MMHLQFDLYRVFFIVSATVTSPALEEINVFSLESVALAPQAPNNKALAVTGTINLFIIFIVETPL